MKKQFLIFSSLCLLLTACENTGNRTDAGRSTRDRSQTVTPGATGVTGPTEDRMDTNRTDMNGRNVVRDRIPQEA